MLSFNIVNDFTFMALFKNNSIQNYMYHFKNKFVVAFVYCLIFSIPARSQYLMDIIDTTKSMGQDMLSMLKRFDRIRFSGYIQPQFQYIESKGAKSYNGGDYSTFADNRFMLRRSRIRLDYVRFSDKNMPKMQFAFQFDATERGVLARDMWGRIFDTKYNCFSVTTGLFARPFGFELNLSSSDRESPERGRMSQILMRTERDLGAMASFQPREKDHKLKNVQVDLGVFNGQGLTATTDFDGYKDIIGRVQLKNTPLSKTATLNIGVSFLTGGIRKNSPYINEMTNGSFRIDSTKSDVGGRASRLYFGADAQLKIKNKVGMTEFRAEYWRGTQPSTATSNETPVAIDLTPLHLRSFDGAYFYFLQNFGKKHQIIVKYDWFDPNKKVKTTDLKKGTNLTAADIRYNTLGLGYVFYANENLKWVLYYEMVKNENTALDNYTQDLKDNNLTCRIQYRF